MGNSASLHGVRLVLLWGALATLYLVGEWLGLVLSPTESNVLISPASGIGMAAIILYGVQALPGVLLGAMLVAAIQALPPVAAVGVIFAGIVEAAFAGLVARKVFSHDLAIERAVSMVRFLLVLTPFSTAMAATFTTVTGMIGGMFAPREFHDVFISAWLARASGAMLIAPLALAGAPDRAGAIKIARIAEAAALLAAFIGLVFVIFYTGTRSPYLNVGVSLALLPLLILAAVRFGRPGAAFALVSIGLAFVWGTSHGVGPLADLAGSSSVGLLYALLIMCSVTIYPIAAMVQERSTARMAVLRVQGELEQRVVERTADVETSRRTMQESEEQWRSIIETSPDYVTVLSIEYKILFLNRAWPGVISPAAVGSPILSCVPERYRDSLKVHLDTVVASCANDRFEMSIANNRAMSVYEARLGPVYRRGEVVGVSISGRDVTEQRRAIEHLTRLNKHVRLLLESTSEGIFGVDRQLRCTFVNRAAASMLGYAADELIGRDMHALIHFLHEDGAPYAREDSFIYRTIRENRRFWAEDEVLWTKDRTAIPVQYTANPISEHGNVSGAAVVFRNVTETRAMARKMDFLATHDPLTGLVNRREFEHRVQKTIDELSTADESHIVAYLDLDQFKIVNDTCGHVAGDELLRQLTHLLHTKLRKGDTLARLGGDEFGVLMNYCGIDDGLRVVEEIRQLVSDFRFTWENKAFTIGVSAGVTIVSADTSSVSIVLSEADTACYMAKDAGRNRVHVYQADDAALAQRRGEMQWVARINSALSQNRFVLYCQPIVPIEQIYAPESIDRDVTAEIHLEILIRMLDEGGQQIPPGAFIPAAERYHLMPAIDRWVVRTMFEWLRANAERFSIVNCWTINLSGQSLSDDSLLEFVRAEIKKSAFSASRICFEITETAAVANLKGATEMIARLKTEGCYFALDDFGSGMSSFAYLKNLPVDFLKIDGNFIRDITRDRVDRAMVEAVNQIGQVMGIQTIAEFVESKAILDALRVIGVDYAQGYAIAPPVPLETLSEEFLSRFLPSRLEIA